MRVSLLNGSTTIYLAGQSGVSETVHSSASGFTIDGARDVFPAKRTRAASATPYDRQNLITTIRFSTTRTFATPAAAQLWALDHDALIYKGTLIIDAGPPYGTYTSRRLLNNAIVAPPSRRTDSCTLWLTYTVTGSDAVPATS